MASAAELARSHWNKTPLYYCEGERYRIYPWLYEAAEFCQHAGEKVLEVGCGTGSDLLQFAKHGAIATGVDITQAHLALACERVGSLAAVVEGDATSLPFPDSSFDYVYSHGVIHHSNQPERIVAEILRVLKRGGRFNIHVYAFVSYASFRLWTHYGQDWRRGTENTPISDVHVDLYTSRSLRRLFAPLRVKVRKHELRIAGLQIPRWTLLPQWFGWYLVVTGSKPRN